MIRSGLPRAVVEPKEAQHFDLYFDFASMWSPLTSSWMSRWKLVKG